MLYIRVYIYIYPYVESETDVRGLRSTGAPTAPPKRSLCAAPLLRSLRLPKNRPSCAKRRSPGRSGGVRDDFRERSGVIWGPFSSLLRSILWSGERFDEKRSTLTKHWQGAAESTSGPPPSDPKTPENRPGSVSRTTVRKERSQKSIRGLPGSLFGRSGGSRGRPGASRGAPGVSQELSERLPERPGSTPEAPRIASDRPEDPRERFWTSEVRSVQ